MYFISSNFIAGRVMMRIRHIRNTGQDTVTSKVSHVSSNLRSCTASTTDIHLTTSDTQIWHLVVAASL